MPPGFAAASTAAIPALPQPPAVWGEAPYRNQRSGPHSADSTACNSPSHPAGIFQPHGFGRFLPLPADFSALSAIGCLFSNRNLRCLTLQAIRVPAHQPMKFSSEICSDCAVSLSDSPATPSAASETGRSLWPCPHPSVATAATASPCSAAEDPSADWSVPARTRRSGHELDDTIDIGLNALPGGSNCLRVARLQGGHQRLEITEDSRRGWRSDVRAGDRVAARPRRSSPSSAAALD